MKQRIIMRRSAAISGIQKICCTIALQMLLLTAAARSETQLFFSENFDGQRFSEGDLLVGWDGQSGTQTDFGKWGGGGSSGTGKAEVQSEVFLSQPRSLALEPGSDGSAVGILANLGTHPNSSRTITQAIRVRVAFRLSQPSKLVDAQLRGPGNTVIARVIFGGDKNSLVAQFADRRTVSLGSVSADAWYWLELLMPGPSDSEGQKYTANLYEEDGSSLVGSQSGEVLNSASGYSYLMLGNVQPGLTVYIDNIRVEEMTSERDAQ